MYIDKILKDAQPADLPVEQPTGFQLVINMKNRLCAWHYSATTLLARAGEVIEQALLSFLRLLTSPFGRFFHVSS